MNKKPIFHSTKIFILTVMSIIFYGQIDYAFMWRIKHFVLVPKIIISYEIDYFVPDFNDGILFQIGTPSVARRPVSWDQVVLIRLQTLLRQSTSTFIVGL